jgi:hypothetical protein
LKAAPVLGRAAAREKWRAAALMVPCTISTERLCTRYR